MIKVIHNRPGCIGCTLCAEQAPSQWVMDNDDGKANLQNAKADGEVFVTQISEGECAANEEAAKNCPTKVIKVVKE